MIDLQAARTFLLTSARLIDRHRFAHLFESAPAEPVIDALRAYRNPDGGFGHALEPDLRTAASQPVGVMHAIDTLDEAGAPDDPMVDQACEWLGTITRADGGVPFCLPSVADAPAGPPWCATDASSMTMTAQLAAVLHRVGSRHPWLTGATDWCWREIPNLTYDSAYDLRFALAFLDVVPDRERAEGVLGEVGPRLLDSGLVALDPHAPGEVHTPLDFSPWPDAPSRRLFEPDPIETHLDALEAGQRDDGGWDFDWAAWAPAPAFEWRGYVTVHALKVLRANGRIDAGTLPAGAHRPPARHAHG